MKKIYYLFMSMTVILLAACSQDEMEQVKEGTLPELRVMVNHPSSISTRATVNDVTTSFESGDKIGVFVINSSGDMMKKNVAYEYDGTKWILANKSDKVYYSSNCSYYAYYPYVEKEDEDDWYYLINSYMDAPTEFFSTFISSWEPLLDQSTLANFNASDLMIGKGTNLNETASVSFTLEHQMGLVRLAYFDWESEETLESVSSMDSQAYFYNEDDEEAVCPIPYNTGGKYFYYIAKPGSTFDFWCWGSAFGLYEEYSVPVDASEGFITDYTIQPSY
jgi:hypothetical protein